MACIYFRVWEYCHFLWKQRNLLSQKKQLDSLSDLEWIIVDEVHELLASERGSQLCLSLERLQIKSKNEKGKSNFIPKKSITGVGKTTFAT